MAKRIAVKAFIKILFNKKKAMKNYQIHHIITNVQKSNIIKTKSANPTVIMTARNTYSKDIGLRTLNEWK